MENHPAKKFEDFNKVLTELYYLVCEYGIERCRPSNDDIQQQTRFYQLVHEGWKKAQHIAKAEIIEIQNEIAEIKRKIKSHNRKNNRQRAKELKDISMLLEGRKRKIQFAINSIVWTILNFQHHILRRFFLNDKINNIEERTLSKTFEFIDTENEDPNKCAICCDLTTFMHIGDVLIIDFAEKEGSPISLIELKEGKINEKCDNVLTQYFQTDCPRNLYYNTLEFGKGELDQLKRMARQQLRGAQVLSAINKGEGTDIATDMPIKIPDEEFIIETYFEIILEMYNELSDEKHWVIRDIDKCLFLGLYNDQMMSEVGFNGWMHSLGVDSPVWDYQQGINIPLARPLFSLPFPPALIKDLVTGKIILKMCLHVPFWISDLNKKYPSAEMQLETVKRSKSNDLKHGHLFKYQNRLIKFTKDDSPGYVGSGILSKILFDFYSPIDSMRPMLTTP
jgi:hypothetical protein